MRIGFFTSAFSDRPLDEVLDFAAETGFDAVEIDAASHVGAPDTVATAVGAARGRGLHVAALTLVGNQLDPDAARRRDLWSRTRDFAAAVAAADVPVLVIFPGRDAALSETDNYAVFADHAEALLAATAGTGLSLAIENWPGPANDFIATTPAGWEQLFARVPDPRLGLEFDPSHLVRLGIDPYAAFAAISDRLKVYHVKDTSIDAARLQAVGYAGTGWWRYRLPGAGLLDWPRLLGDALQAGFDGTFSIEHEDADFGWPRKNLDARKEGERRACTFIRQTMASATGGAGTS